VSFNKINTFDWYRKKVYKLPIDYNPEDRFLSFQKSLEWDKGVP
jgi:2-oxoglutarate ferredoxin oxidoreductase subunit beta